MGITGQAASLALGKTMFMNAITRNAKSIPGVAPLARGIAGMGYRAAQQGKPLGNKLVRGAASIMSDPKLVDLYEGGYMAGHHAGPEGKKFMRNLDDLRPYIGDKGNELLDLAGSIPTESTGIRRVLDAGATPVSQIPGHIRDAANRAHIYATQTPLRQMREDVVGHAVKGGLRATGAAQSIATGVQHAGTSLRQGLNYLNTPVSQVGSDIRNTGRAIGNATKRMVTNDPLPEPAYKNMQPRLDSLKDFRFDKTGQFPGITM